MTVPLLRVGYQQVAVHCMTHAQHFTHSLTKLMQDSGEAAICESFGRMALGFENT